MGSKYSCRNGCGNSAVIVNTGGVARTLICPDCNVEMNFDEHVSTEWVGINHDEDDYKLAEE